MSDAVRKWRKDFFSLSPRRKTYHYVLSATHQLRIPLYVLGLGLAFLAAWLHTVSAAFGGFYARLEALHPYYLDAMVNAQLDDLARITLLMGIAYSVVVLVVSIVLSHRLVGPGVALRRQVASLREGDYDARIRLRGGDAFVELAEELNGLAEDLAERERRRGA